MNKIEKRIVYIRRKDVKSPLGGDASMANPKIGSSLKGTVPQSGLTRAEEKAWLSELLGISANSPDWGKHIRAYCNNITVPVPFGVGKKLDITLLKEATDTEVAEPANIADYVLWRYCLVYKPVARRKELVNKSPRIRFYLYDEKEDKANKMNAFDMRKKASMLFYSLIDNPTSFEAVLKIMMANHEVMTDIGVAILDVDKADTETKQLALDAISNHEKTRARFIEVCESKDLITESFIEDCIHYSKLHRVPNTATIRRGSMVIGNSMEEAVAFILNSVNTQTVLSLKAELKQTTNKDYDSLRTRKVVPAVIPNTHVTKVTNPTPTPATQVESVDVVEPKAVDTLKPETEGKKSFNIKQEPKAPIIPKPSK